MLTQKVVHTSKASFFRLLDPLELGRSGELSFAEYEPNPPRGDDLGRRSCDPSGG